MQTLGQGPRIIPTRLKTGLLSKMRLGSYINVRFGNLAQLILRKPNASGLDLVTKFMLTYRKLIYPPSTLQSDRSIELELST